MCFRAQEKSCVGSPGGRSFPQLHKPATFRLLQEELLHVVPYLSPAQWGEQGLTDHHCRPNHTYPSPKPRTESEEQNLPRSCAGHPDTEAGCCHPFTEMQAEGAGWTTVALMGISKKPVLGKCHKTWEFPHPQIPTSLQVVYSSS